jgi:hypothetical protein
MRFAVLASAFNDRGPAAMEEVLDALHERHDDENPVVLSLRRADSTVGLVIDVPETTASFLIDHLRAQYPLVQAQAEGESSAPPGMIMWSANLTLSPEVFPLKRFRQLESGVQEPAVDPLTGLLSSLSGHPHDPLRPHIELIIRPATAARVRHARHAVAQLRRPGFAFDPRRRDRYLRSAVSRHWYRRVYAWLFARGAGRLPAPSNGSASRTHDREDAPQAAQDKVGRHLFEVQLRLSVRGPAAQVERALQKLREIEGSLGAFVLPQLSRWRRTAAQRRRKPSVSRATSFLLSTEELATIWHPPTLSAQVPTLAIAPSRVLEAPPVLPNPRTEPNNVLLGYTAGHEHHTAVGLAEDARRRHLYIVGKTGMGKSSLLHTMLRHDIVARRGCCLIDPHGDLSEAVLAAVPSKRTNDVVLFDAGDFEQPVAFNPLGNFAPHTRPLVASGILTAFKKMWGDFFGPRMEHIFRHCLLTLLEIPDTSLVSLVQLLGDVRYREQIVERVSDPIVRAFWLQEFAQMSARLQAEAIAPIQNKVGQFVASPLLRHILGQSRSTIDIRTIMDAGQVLIVNLSKGRMGEDASSLLGSLLISALQLAAMSRADIPEHQRKDFGVYVDEFQAFATESFASILSESRKYRLSLTLANQYLAQMDEATAAAVFGNVGSLLSFQVGAADAELLAAQLGSPATAQDLCTLPRYEAYLRLLIDGQPSRPFSIRTIAPSAAPDRRRADTIRAVSRRCYGRPAAQVAADIARSLAN